MINIWQGDITKLKYDAIVNAANKTLLGGGGVDGAIHRAAGPELRAFNKGLGGCETGEAKIAPGFNLPSQFIILTVGPVWGEPYPEKERLLKSCYYQSLELAKENNIKSIAFPAISTGVYGYPIEKATKVAVSTVKEWLQDNPGEIEKVTFVTFSDRDTKIYEDILEECLEGENI